KAGGYQEIRCPQILDRSLWERSGHWEHYKDNMFTTASENREYAVKPMNCPGHVQVYNSALRSYRDLPLRYGEFGSCHRNESSGSLHGLMRVRGFTQDDGHIFCTEDQIQAEVQDFTKRLLKVYKDFGFNDVIYRLSTRPENRVGSDAIWDKAEKALSDALNAVGVGWELLPGEGAFYGPKIEYSLKDSLGRIWQCGTIQVDFNMPERLGAEYVAEDNSRKHPVMLHRAIVGSLERFIGILIENFGGAFPLWLSPVQIAVASISEGQADYAADVAKMLQDQGLRAEADLRNDKISYKIRELSLQKIPYVLVVGDQEKSSGGVSVRRRGGEDLGVMPLKDVLNLFKQDLEEGS
ncbi:MAG: threonine--tRNA ligase, partial [Burkholderiaceae bacterium]